MMGAAACTRRSQAPTSDVDQAGDQAGDVVPRGAHAPAKHDLFILKLAILGQLPSCFNKRASTLCTNSRTAAAMAPTDHPSHTNYMQSGFANRIGWGSRPALLLIDVCEAYWNKESPLDTSANPAAMTVPDSIGRLVAAARDGNVPLVWTRVEYTEPDMSDAGIFALKAPLLTTFQKGNTTGLGGWVSGLEPRDGEIVVSKKYPSAFFATDLTTRLQLKNVDTLVICGVSTSGCVRASTLDAMCYGFRPMVSLGPHLVSRRRYLDGFAACVRGVRGPVIGDPQCEHLRPGRKVCRRGTGGASYREAEGWVEMTENGNYSEDTSAFTSEDRCVT